MQISFNKILIDNIKSKKDCFMEINLIAEAFKFMVLGMSTVLSFLVLLVLILMTQAKILMKFFPQKSEEPQSAGRDGVTSSDNLAVIAAIAVALKHKK